MTTSNLKVTSIILDFYLKKRVILNNIRVRHKNNSYFVIIIFYNLSERIIYVNLGGSSGWKKFDK